MVACNAFKIGDKIKCINPPYGGLLVKGEIYEVKHKWRKYVRVNADGGWIIANRFKKIEDK